MLFINEFTYAHVSFSDICTCCIRSLRAEYIWEGVFWCLNHVIYVPFLIKLKADVILIYHKIGEKRCLVPFVTFSVDRKCMHKLVLNFAMNFSASTFLLRWYFLHRELIIWCLLFNTHTTWFGLLKVLLHYLANSMRLFTIFLLLNSMVSGERYQC